MKTNIETSIDYLNNTIILLEDYSEQLEIFSEFEKARVIRKINQDIDKILKKLETKA